MATVLLVAMVGGGVAVLAFSARSQGTPTDDASLSADDPASDAGARSTADAASPDGTAPADGNPTTTSGPASTVGFLRPDGVGAVAFGRDSQAAIGEVMATLGPAGADTGWRQDFYRYALPGRITPFQGTFTAYRQLCWGPSMFCLTLGQRLDDATQVVTGWSIGQTWNGDAVANPDVWALATDAGVGLGSTLDAVEAADPATSYTTGPNGAATFDSGLYQGTASGGGPGGGQVADTPSDSSRSVVCLAAGMNLAPAALGPSQACSYDSVDTVPGPIATGKQLPDQWISIVESLETSTFSITDAHRKMLSYDGLSTAVPVVFRSDDYPSLNPGYWVVALSAGMDEEQAAQLCRDLKARFGASVPVCYQRWLSGL